MKPETAERRPMKKPLLFAAVIAALILACAGGAPTLEPTLRPTYTPYPTPTSQEITTPAIGEMQRFFGDTGAAVERAQAAYDRGEYEEAIISFREAQALHGKPSAVLENRLALAYQGAGQNDLAVAHFSNAIALDNAAVDRVGRAFSYFIDGRCEEAIDDAQMALALEPQLAGGYHSDAESNAVLASCYFAQGDLLLALQHIEAAIEIAELHQYSTPDLRIFEELSGAIRQASR